MNDIEITKKFKMKPIREVAELIDSNLKLDYYGDYKAKIENKSLNKKSRVILVTAINPTKYGEGKTTVAIGLHDALRKMGKKSLLVLREPSMGPVFGLKGGATGGGYAQVVPMQDINLHFNGDMHAITSANNLISACIDNSIYFDNPLKFKEVWFKRCLDVNDRALRGEFNITAASEVMAVFCLATNIDDLRIRLGDIIVGINDNDEFIYVKDLGIVGSLMALLKDAFKPNLVQTLYNNPVLIHGGPFANIAHGCSSVVSLKTATSLADYVVTEAGFGSDAGGYKFIDILMRENELNLSDIVLVATIRALKYNGNDKLEDGLVNLGGHIENLQKLNVNILVVLNKFSDDNLEDIDLLKNYVKKYGLELIVSDSYINGPEGSLDLAKEIVKDRPIKKINFLYNLDDPLEKKIEVVAKEICHAGKVQYSEEAQKKLELLKDLPYPVNFAKTQYSFSDDSKKLGNPKGYTLNVTDIKVNNGAKFIIVYLGNIMTMPGLSKLPNALNIDLKDNEIVGLI